MTYYFAEPLQLCEGTLAYMDDFASWTSMSLGLEIKSMVPYHWLDSAEFLESPCLEEAAGCLHAGTIYAQKPAHPHELVHALSEQNGMNRLPFFTEGIAVALDPLNGGGSGPRYQSLPDPGAELPDPRPYMTAASSPEIDYDLAGAFVSFLLLRYGPANFVTMSRQIAPDSDLSSIAQVFSDVYGVSLDGEVELFVANVSCEPSWADLQFFDCQSDVVPWGDFRWSWDATMDCSDQGVVGGSGLEHDFRSFRSVTFEVPSSGLYEIFTDSSTENTEVTIGRCFGCSWQSRDFVLDGRERRTVELSAGKYFVRITDTPASAAEVNVSLISAGG